MALLQGISRYPLMQAMPRPMAAAPMPEAPAVNPEIAKAASYGGQPTAQPAAPAAAPAGAPGQAPGGGVMSSIQNIDIGKLLQMIGMMG